MKFEHAAATVDDLDKELARHGDSAEARLL